MLGGRGSGIRGLGFRVSGSTMTVYIFPINGTGRVLEEIRALREEDKQQVMCVAHIRSMWEPRN